MELNQTTLRGILAAVLSVDPKYVVPKQGNWWNPQDGQRNIEWCAYQINDATDPAPHLFPFLHEGSEQQQHNETPKLGNGGRFENSRNRPAVCRTTERRLANSVYVAFRSDVKTQFQTGAAGDNDGRVRRDKLALSPGRSEHGNGLEHHDPRFVVFDFRYKARDPMPALDPQGSHTKKDYKSKGGLKCHNSKAP